MKAKEKISVIIPAYNIKNYILNAVQSIVNQSYDNIEVIIIDDGSSDGTETIIDELTVNKRIRVFHKENEGVAKARMEGVLHATGEWVSFVDGDDFIDPDMYLRLLDNAHNYNADIAHCGYQMVFPSRTDFYYNTGKIVQQNNKQGLVDLLRGDYIEPGLWNKLFRRRLFDNLMFCDIIDYSIRNYEDLLMNYYLFKEAEKSVYEDWCPYHYILRSDSAATSRVNQHKMEDPLKVLKQIKQDTKDEEIIDIVNSRILLNLIGLSALPYDGQKEFVAPYRISAHRELKDFLKQVDRKKIPNRDLFVARWVLTWPLSYIIVRNIYRKIRGIDKKYEVR